MSYSFAVRGATKQECLEKAAAKLAKVVEEQPIHVTDEKHAYAAAEAILGTVAEDELKDYYLSVSGSVSVWDGHVTSVGVSVSASQTAKEIPE